MADSDQYIDIMIESLKTKDRQLDLLLKKTKEQSELISGKSYDEVDWTTFDVIMSTKDSAIEKIVDLDDGFQKLYDRVREEVNLNRDLYKDKVILMQSMIRELTDKGLKIQVIEERNRADIERITVASKKEIKHAKRSVNVASNYYKTMSNSSLPPDSQYVDKKK